MTESSASPLPEHGRELDISTRVGVAVTALVAAIITGVVTLYSLFLLLMPLGLWLLLTAPIGVLLLRDRHRAVRRVYGQALLAGLASGIVVTAVSLLVSYLTFDH